MKTAKGSISEAIAHGYYLALMREPTPQTMEVLESLYHDAVKTQSMLKMRPVSIEEDEREPVDPMTVVANAIMNLDGFLMKE
jgi:hypothetical protein